MRFLEVIYRWPGEPASDRGGIGAANPGRDVVHAIEYQRSMVHFYISSVFKTARSTSP